MSKHEHTNEPDWRDAAARYIEDHSDATRAEAAEYATELAEQMAGEHGGDPQDWPSPQAAAHTLMAEDWPDYDDSEYEEDGA
ncbi:MAG TPA: hypothetical protein VGD46_19540 [Rhizobacter sp.]